MAGNPRDVAAACAASLPSIDEGSAGHEDYELYFSTQALRDRGDTIVKTDATALFYEFASRQRFGYWERMKGWTS